MIPRKPRLPAVTFAIVALGALARPASARADDAGACGAAFDESQVQRDAGKLLDARRLLRVCSGAACSRTQQKLCSEWLADVEARVPSFVLSAKDAAGADLVDVKVTMDGAPIATTLDGRAVDVDPGPHTLVFEKADGARAQTTALAAERGKGKLVAVTFPGPPPPTAGVPPPAPSPTPEPARAPAPAPAPPASNGSALRTVGIVTAAVGAAGLVVGGVFGGLALATKGAHCNGGVCDPGSTSTAYTQGNVSTAGFVAGGVLAAAGLTMFFMAPASRPESARGIALAPVLGPGGGGVQLGGAW